MNRLSSEGQNIHPLSLDNHVTVATKSRTSEDILRSTRLSTYSPEPYTQSESDYYPYTSSPRSTGSAHYMLYTTHCTLLFLLLYTKPHR